MSSTQEKRPQEAEFVDWCCRYGVSLEEIVYSGSALRKGNTVDDFCDDDVEYLRKTYDDLYERVIKPIVDSAKREVLEQIRPPQATIDSMKLTQPHKYRGVEYPCCSICGYCPEAINAFIDSQLEQSEESE